MKKLRITVEGKVYEVEVEVLGSSNAAPAAPAGGSPRYSRTRCGGSRSSRARSRSKSGCSRARGGRRRRRCMPPRGDGRCSQR